MLNKRFLLKAFGTWSRKLRPWKLRSSGSSEHWNLRGPILGVEIRGSSLFLACIHPGLVGVGLAGTHVIPNFSELKPGELQEKLRNFLKPLNVDDPVVVLGLPRSEVIVRLVSLPLLAPKSVEEALTLQVEMFKPTDTERFCWDASFLPHETQLSASLALAPQQRVERLVNLFAEAGYPMTCLTVSQFSLVHLYLRGAQKHISPRLVLLDSKGSDLELAVLEGEKLVASRAFSLLDRNLPAEQLVTSELQQALSTLRWQEGEKPAILLSGAVPERVEQALGTFGTVEHFEARLRREGMGTEFHLGEFLGAIAVAVAGIGRGRRNYQVNLVPRELRPSRRRWQRLPTYALVGANAVLLLAVGLRAPVQNLVLLHQYQKEIARLKPQTDEMKGVLEKDKNLRQTLILVQEFEQRGRQPLEALAEVAKQLPEDASLNLFTWRKNQIELAGAAKSASSLLSLLQASQQFEDVKFNGALTGDSSGMERFRLEMRTKEKR
jgi:Tfp pilus assembly protein PilN